MSTYVQRTAAGGIAALRKLRMYSALGPDVCLLALTVLLVVSRRRRGSGAEKTLDDF